MESKQIERLERLATRLENSGLAEYVNISRKTRKILCLSFLSGIARGLGFTIGTTLVLAVVYKILSRIISMNIPFITEWLRHLVETVQGTGL